MVAVVVLGLGGQRCLPIEVSAINETSATGPRGDLCQSTLSVPLPCGKAGQEERGGTECGGGVPRIAGVGKGGAEVAFGSYPHWEFGFPDGL